MKRNTNKPDLRIKIEFPASRWVKVMYVKQMVLPDELPWHLLLEIDPFNKLDILPNSDAINCGQGLSQYSKCTDEERKTESEFHQDFWSESDAAEKWSLFAFNEMAFEWTHQHHLVDKCYLQLFNEFTPLKWQKLTQNVSCNVLKSTAMLEAFVTSKLHTECCLCNSNSINCKRVRKSETGSKIVDGTGTTWETKWDWQSVFIWKAWNPFQVNQHKFHMFAICKIDKKLRCDYELRADVVYAIVVIYSFENALLSE